MKGKDQKSTTGASLKQGFGTAPVYFTSISSILGAILFLRLGYATGMLGFWGALAIIFVGHMITIPTALAISELATNTRVEGGGEYFIISRSFGLKIGTTIGLTLFLAQTISIAFYTIAFAESFYPLFDWWQAKFGFELPRQVISIPTLLILAHIMLTRGAGSGVKLLYAVNIILALSLLLFFKGSPIEPAEGEVIADGSNFGFFNKDRFFIIFAICFPAFTGMTAGVGLSGDLRNPGRSIPLGTMLGTATGLVMYILVVWKLAVSAPQSELIGDQMIMSRIALFGSVVIPLGLAACTSSSAIGAMMVAPRTLQAIAADRTLPFRKANLFLARGRGENKEPRNASIISFAIAFVFVLLGNVDSVAGIISMFFLITYGTLCLNSFLNHFGSPPSYRPRFKSRWYLSLAGFLLSVWVMFMINSFYTIFAYAIIAVLYFYIERTNKEKRGLVNIFKGALFQLNRHLQVYIQKHQASMDKEEWRPAVICVSPHSFEREKILDMMTWICYRHGFGTYFHYIEGYYSKQTCAQAKEILGELVKLSRADNKIYIDTMISPSYTSALAQVIQTPSISGMDNNLVLFAYDRTKPEELQKILENVNMVRAGNFDVSILSISEHMSRPENGIHVWIRETDERNINFMILLGYIILSHPYWKKSYLKIFLTSPIIELTGVKEEIERRIQEGRLPATLFNIEIVPMEGNSTMGDLVADRSRGAALTIIGFREEILRGEPMKFFSEFDSTGDILFVNASQSKDIL